MNKIMNSEQLQISLFFSVLVLPVFFFFLYSSSQRAPFLEVPPGAALPLRLSPSVRLCLSTPIFVREHIETHNLHIVHSDYVSSLSKSCKKVNEMEAGSMKIAFA